MPAPSNGHLLSKFGTTIEELNASLLVGQKVLIGHEVTLDDWTEHDLLDRAKYLPSAEELAEANARAHQAILQALLDPDTDTGVEEVTLYGPVAFTVTSTIVEFGNDERGNYALMSGPEEGNELLGWEDPLMQPLTGPVKFRITPDTWFIPEMD